MKAVSSYPRKRGSCPSEKGLPSPGKVPPCRGQGGPITWERGSHPSGTRPAAPPPLRGDPPRGALPPLQGGSARRGAPSPESGLPSSEKGFPILRKGGSHHSESDSPSLGKEVGAVFIQFWWNWIKTVHPIRALLFGWCSMTSCHHVMTCHRMMTCYHVMT